MGPPKLRVTRILLDLFPANVMELGTQEIEVCHSACPVPPLSSKLASEEKSHLRLERVEVCIWTILLFLFFCIFSTSTCLHFLLICPNIDYIFFFMARPTAYGISWAGDHLHCSCYKTGPLSHCARPGIRRTLPQR